MFRKLLKKSEKGFTIIEAVVAAGVFAFVVSSSLGVYMATMQLDAKSRAEREVLQNGRFIMDYLAKEIRNGRIDYSRTNDTATLSLINQLDEEISLRFTGLGTYDIILTKTGVGSTRLNSDDVLVMNGMFRLSPDAGHGDPFDLANDIHVQPHVMVTLELASANQKYMMTSKINLQSTFGVRQYPARF